MFDAVFWIDIDTCIRQWNIEYFNQKFRLKRMEWINVCQLHWLLVSKVVDHKDSYCLRCAMELFQFIREMYETMGISSSSQHSYKYCINSKNLIILLPTTLFCISSMVFLLFKEKTIQEYADSLYFTTAAFISIFMFLGTVWKTPMTFNLVAKFEKIVQKSK